MRVPTILVDSIGTVGVAISMSAVMSAAMTAINHGVGPQFLSAWLKGWAIDFAVGIPAAAVIVPAMLRLQSVLRNGRV